MATKKIGPYIYRLFVSTENINVKKTLLKFRVA